MRSAVLRSEALRLTEGGMVSRSEAAGLLRLDGDKLLTALSEHHPLLDDRVREYIERELDASDVWSFCVHAAEYPDQLKNVDGHPPALFGLGDADLVRSLEPRRGVAVVGSRRASNYGREIAYDLGHGVSAAGLVTVSGMALGVDGAAHRGALRAGGRTIAVLAGGPDRHYPRSHRLLYEQILESGCVLSENPPGVEAKRYAFVSRNRVIAGLCSITVIVEGTEDSGAQHTIGFAEDAQTLIGAVPGPVNSPLSAGPNEVLTRPGAVLVRGVEDVLESLALEFSQPELIATPPPDLSPLAARVLELVAAGEGDPRAVAACIEGASTREVVCALGELELRRAIERDSRGDYRACRGFGA